MSMQEAQRKFKEFEGTILFMCLEDFIDCCGITFDEWVEQNNIKIEKE